MKAKERTKGPMNHHLISVRCCVCDDRVLLHMQNPDAAADDAFGGLLRNEDPPISEPFCGTCYPVAQLFAVQRRRLNPAVLKRASTLRLYEREAPEQLGGLWARFDTEERQSRASFAEQPTAYRRHFPYELFGSEALRLLPGAAGEACDWGNELVVNYDCIVMRYGRSLGERDGVTVQ